MKSIIVLLILSISILSCTKDDTTTVTPIKTTNIQSVYGTYKLISSNCYDPNSGNTISYIFNDTSKTYIYRYNNIDYLYALDHNQAKCSLNIQISNDNKIYCNINSSCSPLSTYDLIGNLNISNVLEIYYVRKDNNGIITGKVTNVYNKL